MARERSETIDLDPYFAPGEERWTREHSINTNWMTICRAKCKQSKREVYVKYYKTTEKDEEWRHHNYPSWDQRCKLKSDEHPNVLLSEIIEKACTEKNPTIILARQYFKYSLAQRLQSYPLPGPIERKWFIYQMFKAVEQLHSVGLWHGNLSIGNFMVTSWHWVTLVDLYPFKPVKVKDGDEDDASVIIKHDKYFDASASKYEKCCLAPERFRREDITDFQKMDVFSLAWVIAEVLQMDTLPAVKLPTVKDILAYDQWFPNFKKRLEESGSLSALPHGSFDVLLNMTENDPNERKAAVECRQALEICGLFPSWFSAVYWFLKHLHLNARSPDERVLMISKKYGWLITGRNSDAQYTNHLQQEHYIVSVKITKSEEKMGMVVERDVKKRNGPLVIVEIKGDAPTDVKEKLQVSDQIIEMNGEPYSSAQVLTKIIKSIEKDREIYFKIKRQFQMVSDNLPDSNDFPAPADGDQGGIAIILVEVVYSCIPLLRFPSVKLLAVDLLIRMSEFLTDDEKLDRIVPLLATTLQDCNALVQAASVRGLSSVLDSVENFSRKKPFLFETYLLPRFRTMLQTSEPTVITAFAESLACFASKMTSLKDESLSTNDDHKEELLDSDSKSDDDYKEEQIFNDPDQAVLSMVEKIIDAPHSQAKLALLEKDFSRLCLSLQGKHLKTLVEFLLTYLNSTEWQLRYSFFKAIPLLCEEAKQKVSDQFPSFIEPILRMIEPGVNDSHESVASEALVCLYTLINKRLINETRLVVKRDHWSIILSPLLYHPSLLLRTRLLELVRELLLYKGEVYKEGSAKLLLDNIKHHFRDGFVWRYTAEENAVKEAVEALKPPVKRAHYEFECKKAIIFLYSTVADYIDTSSSKYNTTSEAELDGWWNQIIRHDELERRYNEEEEEADEEKIEDKVRKVRKLRALEDELSEMVLDPEDEEKLKSLQPYIWSIVEKQPGRFMHLILGDTGMPTRTEYLKKPESISIPSSMVSLPPTESGPDEEPRGRWSISYKFNFLRSSKGVEETKTGQGVEETKSQAAANHFPREGSANADLQAPWNDAERWLSFRRRKLLDVPPDPENSYSVRDVVTLTEHLRAVTRILVPKDQAFFTTSSLDGTTKIWDLHNMNTTAPGTSSKLTHLSPRGEEIVDACLIENSHSIATASSNVVEVWRVDLESNISESSPCGISRICEVDSQIDPVLAVEHLNGETFSMLVYATQAGFIHGWDLRSHSDAWKLQVRPEFGYITAIHVSDDRNWMATGTNRGYILIWDLRFKLLSKVWRHSSRSQIYHLDAKDAKDCLPNEEILNQQGPRLLVAAGENQAAIWDIAIGDKPLSWFTPRPTHEEPPLLRPVDVPLHPRPGHVLPCPDIPIDENIPPTTTTMRAAVMDSHRVISTSMITGNSDGNLYLWSFSSQPRLNFMKPVGNNSAILDLKKVKLPKHMLISGTRDGLVKLWEY